ncbi:sulfatase-like hydrolase/transferase [Vineibacter terrae]|uniref:sulfatase-like hydrolase/transferase n=1 Tax=Vineibacter terrae TaxID=2586908 RepID=UPI002E35F29B|nr:sulfatase-like hydrolase/transferase [Vineibacter terrae]HEX2885195.1 sulfatase-like hydrolase/transferase [Vineibacter terrae]
MTAGRAPRNLLFILSDEHQRGVTGCYGNPLVKTPNIDRLAASGARFTNAYTPSPICVPARAALATGRWVHQTGCWDNAFPYDGRINSWHRRLRDAGHHVASIGKLHFRSSADDNGFSEELLPMHVVDGIGDLLGMIRKPPAPRGGMPALAAEAGAGSSSYNDYDHAIADAACDWLAARAGKAGDKPWALMVSFVRPHFPLVPPQAFFDLYDPATMPLPRLATAPDHPAMRALRDCMNYADYFADDAVIRRAIAAYYGLVSYLDHNVGRVLDALRAAGLAGDTRIIYTSDHGDNLGTRGLWGKSVMYEESAAVPFIAAGPDIAPGRVVPAPVSLIDVYRSALECVGTAAPVPDRDLPSRSIWPLIEGADAPRVILSEYHAAASVAGTFMVRRGRWKYVYHAGYRPELFDLRADPGETTDLATDPAYVGALDTCERALRDICDPDQVDARAFADQAARIAQHGGVEAIMKRGDFGHTPPPGEAARFA